MLNDLILLQGPSLPARPVVLDSPHSGVTMPADFGAALGADDLREGEDCFIDELWRPAVARGIPLLAGQGYDVKINHPFKGVELVRAHADPSNGRHSLQLEVNKRLYMDEVRRERHAGFDRLQADLMALLDAIDRRFVPPRDSSR